MQRCKDAKTHSKFKTLLFALLLFFYAFITLSVQAFEDCVISTDGKLSDISIEKNDIIDVYPLHTVMNEKNTLFVHPLKEGNTRFCVLKNGKEIVMFNVEVTEESTVIDDVDGFDILTIDTPPGVNEGSGRTDLQAGKNGEKGVNEGSGRIDLQAGKNGEKGVDNQNSFPGRGRWAEPGWGEIEQSDRRADGVVQNPDKTISLPGWGGKAEPGWGDPINEDAFELDAPPPLYFSPGGEEWIN